MSLMIYLTSLLVLTVYVRCDCSQRIALLEEKFEAIEKKGSEQEEMNQLLVSEIKGQTKKVTRLEEKITELQDELEHYKNSLSEKDQTPIEIEENKTNASKQLEAATDIIDGHTQTNHLFPSLMVTVPNQNEDLTADTLVNYAETKNEAYLRRNLKDAELYRRLVLPIPTLLPKITYAFHAVNSRPSTIFVEHHGNFVFDLIKLNSGSMYETSNGVATIAKTGLYMFSVSIIIFDVTMREIHATIVKDASVIGNVYAHGDRTRADQGSVTVVTHVNRGQQVWVRQDATSMSYNMGINGYASFTGVLLAEN